MYCTLNTPKIDMDQVLCGQICPNDIVFVHRKGRRKDVEVRKSEQFLGLTIADNGYGCSYIKKIRTNSTASRVPFIQVSFFDFFFILISSLYNVHIALKCNVLIFLVTRMRKKTSH